MGLVENLATAALAVLSLALFIISARAWFHTRSTKVLLLTCAFGLFLIKGLVLSFGLFAWADWETRLFVPMLLFDLVILLALYMAVLKRSGV